MTFEELQRANELTKPTDIGKGKEYIEVNQRVKAFRMLYPNGVIETELLSNENGVVIFKAIIRDDEMKILGTGTAYEKENSTFINKTSYIENCETSAVGRALAFCGIGIDASIASKEEVENAKLNQEDKPKAEAKKSQPKKTEKSEVVSEAEMKTRVLKYVNDNNVDIDELCAYYHVDKLTNMTSKMLEHYISFISKQGGNI